MKRIFYYLGALLRPKRIIFILVSTFAGGYLSGLLTQIAALIIRHGLFGIGEYVQYVSLSISDCFASIFDRLGRTVLS